MASQPSKRKRNETTAFEKREIARYKEEHPKASLDFLSKHFGELFGHSVGKSTIGDILKSKEKWLTIPEDSAALSRARNAKHKKMEEALFLWMNDMTSKNAAVNDEMLILKAKDFGDKLSIKDFAYSRGWLARFKSRHSISKQVLQGEAASADKTAVIAGREELKKVLSEYDAEAIFNIDETGLFYRLGPNYTLATKATPGVKRSKDRITVALCANASGTVKVKPFVIAK
ncbi:jerky protein homolog, partial [Haliotis rubra]|uniref:jerky protein homolog n=1 Tax=Haliotis rubra TaxID=36100 RepID=UPI001EE566BE